MARIKLKSLESFLQDIDGFDEPKVQLEQYETPPHLAAQSLYTIESSYGDIDGKLVADLGCGTGRLLAGLTMLGAQHVVGVDIDPSALETCRKNLDDLCDDSDTVTPSVDLILADVCSGSVLAPFHDSFDCVVMNPPFGTKNNEGIDMEFVKQGLLLTNGSVYSLHKSSTRDHIVKVSRSWGVQVQVLAELRFNLPKVYSFHRRDTEDIEVDMIRFTRTAGRTLKFEKLSNSEVESALSDKMGETYMAAKGSYSKNKTAAMKKQFKKSKR